MTDILHKQQRVLFSVIAVIAISELAVSFYIPLLPIIRAELKVSEFLIQQSVTLYLLGIGISAIFYGGLSDALGRKWMVVSGLAIFCATSMLCFWVSSAHLLVVLRLCQGLGAGVAWTVGNAMIRDIFEGKKFAKAMILIHLISGIEPAISYVLGSYIGSIIGWRMCFLLISIAAAIMLIYCLPALPETLMEKKKFRFKDLILNYYTLAKSKKFLLYLTIKVLSVAIFFVEITNLSLIFIEQYGLSVNMFGFNMILFILAYTIGGFISNKLVDYYEYDQVIKFGIILVLGSNIVLLPLIYFYDIPAHIIQLVKTPFAFGLALIFGNTTCCIVDIFPKIAGSASAKMITMEMIASSFFTYFVSLFYNGTFYPIICFIIVTATIAYMALRSILTLKRREALQQNS